MLLYDRLTKPRLAVLCRIAVNASCSIIAAGCSLCATSPHTRTQIVEVINERKLAKTLSGFINQIFDKASHARPAWHSPLADGKQSSNV